MTNREFFDATALQYQVKNLTKQVEDFASGEKYIKMQREHERALRKRDKKIKMLESQLSMAHAQTVNVRNQWFEVFEDMEREQKQTLLCMQREMEKLEARALKAEQQRDEALDKLRDRTQELYNVKNELYETEQKMDGLIARINRDYTNSSKSSSQSPNHKTIPNSREKSGRKPGGQKGHLHHPRKQAEPTKIIHIPAPAAYVEDPNFKETGHCVKKQHIKLHLGVEVIEYRTPEFRNQTTGQRVHAPFPAGIRDDVVMDGSIKALAYLLNNECCVSIDKTKKLIFELSGGKLDLSSGMICNLSRQFSEKTKEERNEIFLKLVSSPLMHTDFTFGRVNGKQAAAIICASEDCVLYQGREKKGNEGVKGSPLEFYDGTVVSDHEAALIKHGSRHQECMVHIKRYIISSIENEKNLTWNTKLKKWIDDAMSYRRGVSMGDTEDPQIVSMLLQQYDEIMQTAQEEYTYEPPSKYFMDGYNLYKRMSENKEDYVLFLKDSSVPFHNNLSERHGRKVKRKSAQVMCFRSQEGLNRFCDGLSILESIKAKDENLYESVSKLFNKGIEV